MKFFVRAKEGEIIVNASTPEKAILRARSYYLPSDTRNVAFSRSFQNSHIMYGFIQEEGDADTGISFEAIAIEHMPYLDAT